MSLTRDEHIGSGRSHHFPGDCARNPCISPHITQHAITLVNNGAASSVPQTITTWANLGEGGGWGRGEVRVVKGKEKKSGAKGKPLPCSGHRFLFSLKYQFASNPA